MSVQLVEQFDLAFSSVDISAARAYEDKVKLLINYVNNTLEKREDIETLIGLNNTLDVMKLNHENHAYFMISMFQVKSPESFLKTVIWVYKSYILRGFSPDYFPVELNAWKEAVDLNIQNPYAQIIKAVYDLMIENHKNFLQLSGEKHKTQVKEEYVPQFNKYLASLLDANIEEALKVCNEYILSVSHIPDFWENVIEPALYEVGNLWSLGEISVGQEHIATSITQRVMSIFYPMILKVKRYKGHILVAGSPGELHEVGARMLSDLLELDGWDVDYMGANAPSESIISFIKDYKPKYLCISTTIKYNIKEVKLLIQKVRELDTPVTIFVGGQAYHDDPELWKHIGADGCTITAKEILEKLNKDISL